MAGLTPKQEAWPTDRPKPYPANPRQITDKAIAKVATSIREFGFQQPIVVDTQGVIIAGHTRLAAAKQLKLEQVPVIVADLPEAKARAYRLADNRTAQETSWLDDLLGEELSALEALDFDLDAIGFDEAELRALMSDDEELDRAEQTPYVPEEAVSKLGDLWLLDEHRVYCGDATNAGHVAQVLSERKPHLMVTDPPYGVDFTPQWRKGSEGRSYMPGKEDKEAVWEGVWVLFPGDVVYIWHASAWMRPLYEKLAELGFEHRAQIIWNKDRFIIGRGHYSFNHEPCFYGIRHGGKSHWTGQNNQSTLWTIAHRASDTGHGAQKPIDCMRKPIWNNSAKGDAVYDPFLGSGTTLIAAEMEDRICLGLELHPPYVDVIVQRWQEFTGREATRLDGVTFDELKAKTDTIGTAAGQHRPGRSNQQATA